MPIEQARDADLRGSAPAIVRAAQRARELAQRTQTAVVLRRNGQLVHERMGAADAAPALPHKD